MTQLVTQRAISDVRGEPIMAGDIIVYNSSVIGNLIGLVKYDSSEKTSIHMMKAGGAMQYIQKPWNSSAHPGILNLSRLPQDLDSLI